MILGRVTPSKGRETNTGDSMIFDRSVKPTSFHFRPSKDTHDKHRPWSLFCIHSTSLQLGKARAGRGLRRIGTSAPHCHPFGRDSLRKMSAPLEDGQRYTRLICRHPIAIAATDGKVVATSSSRAGHVPEPTSPAATRTKCVNDALHRTMSNESRRDCASLRLAIGHFSTRLPG